VKTNHWFYVDDTAPTVMHSYSYVNEDDDDGHTQYNFRNGIARRDEMIENILNNKTTLIPPGLKPIKQVELRKKWGHFIPEDERDELCPKPSDDVIQQVAQEKAANATKRRRTRSSVRSTSIVQV
jgi:hypothetical protein